MLNNINRTSDNELLMSKLLGTTTDKSSGDNNSAIDIKSIVQKKKGGRPKSENKRDFDYSVRLTKEESDELLFRARTLETSPSAILRSFLTFKMPELPKLNSIAREQYLELTKLSTNINQIAHALNVQLKAGNHEKLNKQAIEHLNRTIHLIREIQATLVKGGSMISKIIRGSDFKGALNYVFNDKDDNHHDRATLLATNCGGNDASSIAAEMRTFANTNNRIVNPVHHIILSHNKDNLTNDQWCELAGKYIEKMGYQNHQYALIRHNDTNNDHCHLIINGINMETSKSYKSSYEKLKSLNAIKEITREMDLTKNTAQQAKHLDHGNHNMRTIQDAIDAVFATTKGVKPDEFEKQLKKLGVTIKRQLLCPIPRQLS